MTNSGDCSFIRRVLNRGKQIHCKISCKIPKPLSFFGLVQAVKPKPFSDPNMPLLKALHRNSDGIPTFLLNLLTLGAGLFFASKIFLKFVFVFSFRLKF